jgi:hypothetical protein
MKNKIMLDGFIQGTEACGAKHIKTDENFVYFKVKIGSTMDDDVALQKAKKVFGDNFGLGIKIAKVKEL